MINILLNGSEYILNQALNLKELLSNEGYADKVCAVSINKTFIPKTEHEKTIINENDRVDIVQPIAGG